METSLIEKINKKTESKTSIMKAAVIAAPETINTVMVAIPEPKAGEVRVKLEGSGVCASNTPVWEGRDWFSYPIAAGNPGHEGWGVIDAVGPGVTGLSVGDRVTCLSYNAYAEYDIAKADEVIILPDFLSNKPFPGEALGCVMNIFNRCDIHAGQTAAVVGTGFLGLLLIQLLKSAGANVIALSKRPFSLQSAAAAGADQVIAMDGHYEVIEKVKQLTSGKFCDRVIEVTGKEWPLNLSIELTAERGKLIVAGFHQDGMRQVNMQLLNWRGIDMINAHERDPRQYVKGIQNAIKAIEEGKMDPFPLFTHSLNLDEAEQAFSMLSNRPEGFIKALLVNEVAK
ncbi:MDR/zinc-dependent alcohol dehydrogenase-like family protein [Legionella jordanis]|uniref:Threonine(-3-)dehydrogenase n=1 Tax=Legionella jordanis TaxID=456 RepID=A0A0W0VG04_9GAMM|nr:zinc-binding dehydrogenase [Legionella jordanis]KTD19056.1 threonine(-3-)dehydrogenase [Legionella jordanis]VEH13159.1 quinone oxidoreductase [Legionella jordanis]